MKTKLLLALALVASVFASAESFAAGSRCPESYINPNSTHALRSNNLYVGEGATESVQLCRQFRVHTLYIQAEGYYSDAYAQVMVNGRVKGTLYVPGRDPHYVVTVEEDTASIEIASIRGNLNIRAVRAVMSESYNNGGNGGGWQNPGPGPQPGPQYPLPNYVNSQMGQMSSRIIWIVNNLENYTNYRTYGEYLLPIRKAAAEALAMSEARGDSSMSARAYYEKLLLTLDTAAPYIDNAFEVDYAFNLAVELMSKREQIRRLLQ